jgi:hypothetical protein
MVSSRSASSISSQGVLSTLSLLNFCYMAIAAPAGITGRARIAAVWDRESPTGAALPDEGILLASRAYMLIWR